MVDGKSVKAGVMEEVMLKKQAHGEGKLKGRFQKRLDLGVTHTVSYCPYCYAKCKGLGLQHFTIDLNNSHNA